MLVFGFLVTFHEFGHYLIAKLNGVRVLAFNVGFGIGALLLGWLVDKGSLRWIYAGLVLAWSVVGFATGFANGFVTLLICRLLPSFRHSPHL